MIQEFRYLAAGGLGITLILIGAFLLDPPYIESIDRTAAVLLVLLTTPAGWLSYQWLGYQTYKAGGIESYWEIHVLRDQWASLPPTLVLPFGGSTIEIEKGVLSIELQKLGRSYFEKLRWFFPKTDIPSDQMYLSAFHDVIFMGQREHDPARGMYGIHNALSMIYLTMAWGTCFIGVALVLRFVWLRGICLSLAWIAGVALALALLLWGTRRLMKAEHEPLDMIGLFGAMFFAAPFLKTWPLQTYGSFVLLFLVCLFWKSRIPWTMLKVEAELREELLTWLYINGKKASVPTNASRMVADTQEPKRPEK